MAGFSPVIPVPLSTQSAGRRALDFFVSLREMLAQFIASPASPWSDLRTGVSCCTIDFRSGILQRHFKSLDGAGCRKSEFPKRSCSIHFYVLKVRACTTIAGL